jgi:hypothetical protein
MTRRWPPHGIGVPNCSGPNSLVYSSNWKSDYSRGKYDDCFCLTPKAIPGALVVPLRSGFEIAGTWRQILTDYVLVEGYAKARTIRHLNEPALDNGLADSFLDKRRPPRHVERMVFESEEILRCRCAMGVRHTADRRSREVHCHWYSIFLGHVSDFVGFKDPARGGEVRMNLADSVVFAEDPECPASGSFVRSAIFVYCQKSTSGLTSKAATSRRPTRSTLA